MFLHHTSFLEDQFGIWNRMLHSLFLSFALLKDKVYGLLRKIYSQYKKAEKSKFWMLQLAIINYIVGCDSLGKYLCYRKELCRMLSTT